MKNIKLILKYILIFVVLICMYFASLILSSLIPSSTIKENTIRSSEYLKQYGEKEIVDLKYKKEEIFLFTDALMLNTAYSIDSENPIESALLARKNYIPGQTQTISKDKEKNLGASKIHTDKNGNIFQVDELYGLMHGENITESFEYARYWHGYLILLRPLLLVTSYKRNKNANANNYNFINCIYELSNNQEDKCSDCDLFYSRTIIS